MDLIAKADPDLFFFLVKKVCNEHAITIVLVSSEGHVIPLSSRTRCNVVKEVVDIDKKTQSMDYLDKRP